MTSTLSARSASGIEIGIVGRVGIGGEHRRGHLDVHLVQHLGQAAAALAPHHPMHAAAPEVLAVARGLQLAVDRHRAGEAQVQPLERRIVGIEPPVGPDGAALQVPDVHSQHSRLK